MVQRLKPWATSNLWGTLLEAAGMVYGQN